ncbi:MAG: type II secretion system F family protein [Firmicutes bacterium]|nr:type II secretion system F family protein [Bacillota bacterium]
MLDQILGMSLKDKASFFRQLATLIESGMTIMSCLDALRTMPNNKVRKIITRITPMMQEGMPLSEALATFPEFFDAMTIMMIRAGEVGGQLEVRLKNIAAYMERLSALQQKTVSKLIYPLVLLHMGIFIPPLVLLITKGICAYLSATLLPLMMMYAVVIGFFVLYKIIGSVQELKETIDAVFLYFPVIGSFFRAKAIYRFVLVLADLTDAGISLDTAIDTAGKACGNAMAGKILKTTIPFIQSGQSIASSFGRTGLFPPMTIHMIQTGEEAGSLPAMLSKTAEILGMNLEEVQNRVFTIVPVIFYLIIAAYVGFTIIKTFAGIYAPLMDMYPK